MIRVTCAVIVRGAEILAVQRSASMDLPGKWEFPGGKIKPGETEEECLVREVAEELDLTIRPLRRLNPAHYRYPAKEIELIPYLAVVVAGEIRLHEHAAMVWLRPDELPRLDWCPADMPILAEIATITLPLT